ncbi:DUF3576 domain-containing protein [Candidatus Lariskella endosymbiont of Hedychridium roseum]|uniref:DUF3576 domain-containing protein n=1 Tax=Candidatus Lariskella endosymbiont of Hedychridium roseum TaxID=3077949 RepID=UPI0030D28A15
MNRQYRLNLLFILCSLLLLPACTNISQKNPVFPPSKEEVENKRVGSLLGGETGGFTIYSSTDNSNFTAKPKKQTSNCSKNLVWNTMLDSLSDIQIAFTDKESGTAVTHWQYSNNKQERKKYRILLLQDSNDSYSVNVTALKQSFFKSAWSNDETDSEAASKLQNLIINRINFVCTNN